jgi:hypothetical protein
MTENKVQSVIIRQAVGYVPYWACDDTLKDARHRFKMLTGKYPTDKAQHTLAVGSFEQINSIEIDDLGTIHAPAGTELFTL